MKRSANTDLVYGIRPVIEAIRSGKELDSVLIKKGLSGELYSELKELLRERGIRSQLVPAERFGQFGNKNHQGVVAYLSPLTFSPLKRLWPVFGIKANGLSCSWLTALPMCETLAPLCERRSAQGACRVFVAKGSARIGSDAIKTRRAPCTI